MNDWWYRHRDPVAFGLATLIVLAGGWGARSMEHGQRPLVAPAAMQVTLDLATPPTVPAPSVPPSAPPPPLPSPLRPTPSTPPPAALAQASPAPSESSIPVSTAAHAMASPAPAEPVRRETSAADAPSRPAVPETPPAQATVVATVESGYAVTLRRYLESIKRYPSSREARQLRPVGTVRVWIELDRTGQLREAGLEQSSGVALLDLEALRTARTGRYPPFPDGAFAGAAQHRFVFALEYKLDAG